MYQNAEKEELLIPPQMFGERKTVFYQLLFCKTNDQQMKTKIFQQLAGRI